MKISNIVEFIRNDYKTNEFIPLHAPIFPGNEKKYLSECVDSTFVSSVGKFVDKFEQDFQKYTGATRAVAVVNGTNAITAALYLSGVRAEDEVITQALTFVATCNAISYLYAVPVFVDVDKKTMGMSPDALNSFLEKEYVFKNGKTVNRKTGRILKACIPMHTFGHPVRIREIADICQKWNLSLIEDAAESLGSYNSDNTHTGITGSLGVFSFNGNKIMTTGGGGMIVTMDEELGHKAKYITSTAKKPHPYEFFHDELGFNYRMPNINAALGCSQLESLPVFLEEKRKRAERYKNFFISCSGIDFFCEPAGCRSNYWLNAVILADRNERDIFLKETNDAGVMTRPIWTLMSKLPMYKNCLSDDLKNSHWFEDRVVNIPSGVGSL